MVTKRKKKTKYKIDVLAHAIVPKHSILTIQETHDLLKQYSIKLENLPTIFEDDPVSIALGTKEGDVLKIIRPSDTIVDSVNTYRFVIKRRKK